MSERYMDGFEGFLCMTAAHEVAKEQHPLAAVGLSLGLVAWQAAYDRHIEAEGEARRLDEVLS